MTHLERAIQESKEREEKATKWPWTAIKHSTYMKSGGNWWTEMDLEFIAASRTWEPKFRRIVELLIPKMKPEDMERINAILNE